MTKELPQFVRDLLASPPERGAGLNLWLFRAARVLHPYRSESEIVALLSAATGGLPVKMGEIERAVRNSRTAAWSPDQPATIKKTRATWPTVDSVRREAAAATGNLADLWEASPVRLVDSINRTEAVIDALFEPDSLLCVGKTMSEFKTRHREELRGELSEMALIVPSPMSAVTGLTQDGRPSEHSLSNTGGRRFLVIEQDSGTLDEQAGVLLHLKRKAPMVLAVHSGKKSIHGWFSCKGRDEEFLRKFMRYAVALGADRATWTRSQFVRMPDGKRDDGTRQTVFFFFPNPMNVQALTEKYTDPTDFEEIPDLEAESAEPVEIHFKNDVGYADAFAEKFRDRLRFIPEEDTWLVFDQLRGWHRDQSGEVEAHAADFSRELYLKALEEAKTLDPREAHARISAAAKLGDKKRITPALSLAQVNRVLVVHATDLDRDPYLLGAQNGVIDLRDGTFRPHSPAVMVTRSVSCNYDPAAKCPTFAKFLEEVQPDLEMRSYLQRLSGYSLTGGIGEHLLPFHYGVGANGKGTLLEQTLFKILGTYAAKITDALVYVNRRGTEPHLEIAGLCGIRFALGEENEDGGSLNERLLKSMTGGDRQKGRFHYKPFFEFNPTAKIHLVGNHRPKIVGRDEGIWRRFRLVEWSVQIPEERRDLRLDQKIAAEFPGILNWMIEGALALGDRGTCPPSAVMAATDKLRQDSDAFGDFLREKIVADENAIITKAELFDLYKDYCSEQEIHDRYRYSKRKVGHLVIERGYDECLLHESKKAWRGLRARKMTD